jgi:light-independent protochlorophyllide reductase subunit B
MFRDDFEFHDGAAPSHLGPRGPARLPAPAAAALRRQIPPQRAAACLGADAEKELARFRFFVRGKARRNTERFARNGREP